MLEGGRAFQQLMNWKRPGKPIFSTSFLQWVMGSYMNIKPSAKQSYFTSAVSGIVFFLCFSHWFEVGRSKVEKGDKQTMHKLPCTSHNLKIWIKGYVWSALYLLAATLIDYMNSDVLNQKFQKMMKFRLYIVPQKCIWWNEKSGEADELNVWLLNSL